MATSNRPTPRVVRYDLSVLLDATVFVQVPGTQLYGFAVANLPAGVPTRMGFGLGTTLFTIRQGLFMRFDDCTPMADGVRIETALVAAGSFLEIIWFIGSTGGDFAVGGNA